MKKMSLVVLMVLMSSFLGGCSLTSGGSGPGVSVQKKMEENVRNYEGKVSGKLNDSEYTFMTNDGEIVNVTSKKVDLSQMIGKNLKITGMFSGSTLYIDAVEEMGNK